MKHKKIMVIILAMIMAMSLVACGGKKTEFIGTWEIVDNPTWYMQIMELYEGGTGKGFMESEADSWYNLKWEFTDNVLNITVVGGFELTTGYKVDGNTMTSVDGDFTYIKSEK